MFSNMYFLSEEQPRRTLLAAVSKVVGNALNTILAGFRKNHTELDHFSNFFRLLLLMQIQVFYFVCKLWENLFSSSSGWLLLTNVKKKQVRPLTKN